MKGKMRGSIYGIGLALVLFGLVSISVLPPAATATYKDEGGSNSVAMNADASCHVDIVNSQFELDTYFDADERDDNDGCACYCGQGIVMADGGLYIDHVVKLSDYREAEEDYSYECDHHEWDGYETWTSGDTHYREDTWEYEISRVDADHVKNGTYSCVYSYQSDLG